MLVFSTEVLLSHADSSSFHSCFYRFLNLTLDIAVRGRFEDRPLLTSTACECLREIELCTPGTIRQYVEPLSTELERQQCIILQSFVRLVQTALFSNGSATGTLDSTSSLSEQKLLSAVSKNLTGFTSFVIASLVENLRPVFQMDGRVQSRVLTAFHERYSKFVTSFAPILLSSCAEASQYAPSMLCAKTLSQSPSHTNLVKADDSQVFQTMAGLSSNAFADDFQKLFYFSELVDREIRNEQQSFSSVFSVTILDSAVVLHAKLAVLIRRFRHFGDMSDCASALDLLSKSMPHSRSHFWTQSFFWFVPQLLLCDRRCASAVLPVVGRVLSARPQFLSLLADLLATLQHSSPTQPSHAAAASSMLADESAESLGYLDIVSELLIVVFASLQVVESSLAGVLRFLIASMSHHRIPFEVVPSALELLQCFAARFSQSALTDRSVGYLFLELVQSVVADIHTIGTPDNYTGYEFDAAVSQLLSLVNRAYLHTAPDVVALTRVYRNIFATVQPAVRHRLLAQHASPGSPSAPPYLLSSSLPTSVSSSPPSSSSSSAADTTFLVAGVADSSFSKVCTVSRHFSSLQERMMQYDGDANATEIDDNHMLLLPLVLRYSPESQSEISRTLYGCRLRLQVPMNVLLQPSAPPATLFIGTLAPGSAHRLCASFNLGAPMLDIPVQLMLDFFDTSGNAFSASLQPLCISFDDLCLPSHVFFSEEQLGNAPCYDAAIRSQVHQWTRFVPYVRPHKLISRFSVLLGVEAPEHGPKRASCTEAVDAGFALFLVPVVGNASFSVTVSHLEHGSSIFAASSSPLLIPGIQSLLNAACAVPDEPDSS
eukprot:ANDGO_08236.mRNA.1 hypothetical protein